jgi:hypothetical protein
MLLSKIGKARCSRLVGTLQHLSSILNMGSIVCTTVGKILYTAVAMVLVHTISDGSSHSMHCTWGACCTERCQHLHGTSAPAGKTSVCITCGLRRTCAQHWRHGSMGPAQASRAVLLFSLCWGLQLRLDTTYLASSQPTKACQDHQGSLPARRRGGGLRNLRPLRMQQVAAVALSPAHQHPAQHTQAMAPTTTGDTPSSTACTVPLYLSGLDRSWHIHGSQPRHLNTAPRVAPACRTAQHSATHCTTYTCI